MTKRPKGVPEGKSWCNKCSNIKSTTEFSKDRHRPTGLKLSCKTCDSITYRDNYDPEKEWARKLKPRYGITPDDYVNLLEKQNGTCQICKQPPQDRKLHVDHCHTTGKVRGLLCFRCNGTLGKVEESFDILEALITYLKETNV